MIHLELSIRLVSLVNERESRWKAARRASEQRNLAGLVVANAKVEGRVPELPLLCVITRVGRRRMDSDNLAISAKHVRDGIADALGIDDADPRISWSYQQEIGPAYMARIRLQQRVVDV